MEMWRTIPIAPEYQVSSAGRVRDAESGRILACRLRPDGYRQVGLRKGQPKRLWRKVSQLVCEAFNGARPFPKAVAAHHDGTRTNDTSENLYWATQKENHADRERHGRAPKGVRNGAHILTDTQVLEIKAALRKGIVQKDLAERFGVSSGTISNINTGKNWRHL